MKQHLKKLIKSALPESKHLPLQFRYIHARDLLDPEMFFVERLLPRNRRFLDIGANVGLYAYYLSSRFESVDAFEPLSEVTQKLKATRRANIKVHNVALSNTNTHLNFFIPIRDGKLATPLASLEPREKPYEERKVEVKRLDDYGFTDVDLIKIDVEGHEVDVLAGAIETIQASRPLLIIEIEQRHIDVPIDKIFNQIIDMGYSGYFLQEDHLMDLREFSCQIHQDTSQGSVSDRRYVNNFIFMPNTKR